MHCLMPLHRRPFAPQLIAETDFDDYTPRENRRDTVLRTWETAKAIVEKFWQGWLDEYLTTIRERDRTLNLSGSLE
jgi:hypothetical protein